MSNREEFEVWLSSEYPWGNEALDKAFFSGNDDNGYYTGGDFIYDGSSCADALFWAWRGWQESHKQGKAKCAALAAENAWLKESRQRLAEFIHDELDADYPLNIDIKTPATDAFLAEVRAQGMEMFAEHLSGMNISASETSVREFAAQLRQGGAV